MSNLRYGFFFFRPGCLWDFAESLRTIHARGPQRNLGKMGKVTVVKQILALSMRIITKTGEWSCMLWPIIIIIIILWIHHGGRRAAQSVRSDADCRSCRARDSEVRFQLTHQGVIGGQPLGLFQAWLGRGGILLCVDTQLEGYMWAGVSSGSRMTWPKREWRVRETQATQNKFNFTQEVTLVV